MRFDLRVLKFGSSFHFGFVCNFFFLLFFIISGLESLPKVKNIKKIRKNIFVIRLPIFNYPLDDIISTHGIAGIYGPVLVNFFWDFIRVSPKFVTFNCLVSLKNHIDVKMLQKISVDIIRGTNHNFVYIPEFFVMVPFFTNLILIVRMIDRNF